MTAYGVEIVHCEVSDVASTVARHRVVSADYVGIDRNRQLSITASDGDQLECGDVA